MWKCVQVPASLYLSAFSSMLDAIKHGPEFCQPLAVHCSHTLHVLLQHKAKVNNKLHRYHLLFLCWQSCSEQIFYLGGHDELMIDDVVRSIAHTKQGAGRMKVAWHARPHIHIFTDALGTHTCTNNKSGWGKWHPVCCSVLSPCMGALKGQSRAGQLG